MCGIIQQSNKAGSAPVSLPSMHVKPAKTKTTRGHRPRSPKAAIDTVVSRMFTSALAKFDRDFHPPRTWRNDGRGFQISRGQAAWKQGSDSA
jgi:hypothetical protein